MLVNSPTTILDEEGIELITYIKSLKLSHKKDIIGMLELMNAKQVEDKLTLAIEHKIFFIIPQ